MKGCTAKFLFFYYLGSLSLTTVNIMIYIPIFTGQATSTIQYIISCTIIYEYILYLLDVHRIYIYDYVLKIEQQPVNVNSTFPRKTVLGSADRNFYSSKTVKTSKLVRFNNRAYSVRRMGMSLTALFRSPGEQHDLQRVLHKNENVRQPT